MANILNKMRDILLGPEDDEEYYYEGEDEIVTPTEKAPESEVVRATKRTVQPDPSNSKIVNIHTNVQMQVVISYPETVDDASYICDYLKDTKMVVVNLENVDREQCQRIVDFLSGVSYAINGEIQSVSSRIFIVAPSNVSITGQFKEELKANEIIFPWVSSMK